MKGYEPDIDWNAVDPTKLNVQGDAGNARLTGIFHHLSLYVQA